MSTHHAEDVTSRPGPLIWLLVGLMMLTAAIGGSFLLTGQVEPGEEWQPVLFAAVFLVSAAGIAFWTRRSSIRTDAEGLHWSGFRGSRFVPWEDITDYYEQLLWKMGAQIVIETRAGTVKVGTDWTRIEALRSVVMEKATHARYREWGLWGSRPGEQWVETFDYDSLENRLNEILGPAVLALVAGGWIWMIVRSAVKAPQVARDIGWGLTLAAAVLWLLLTGLYGLVFIRIVPITLDARRRRRRNERITATHEGLLFQNIQRRVAATWPDVRDYYIGPTGRLVQGRGRCVVVTTQGEFEYRATLRNARRLMALVMRHATNAAAGEWRARDDEVLPVDVSRWIPQGLAERSHVYHYRTRTNRAFLWLLTAGMIAGVAALWFRGGDARLGDRIGEVVGTAAALWGWWRYRTAAVVTSEQSLTQFAPFCRHVVSWSDVRECRLHRNSEGGLVFNTVEGSHDRVRFAGTIADVESLQTEILRYTSKQ